MCSLLFTYVHSEWRGGWLSYYGGAGSYTPYSSDISGGAVFGTFSQNQSNTVSYNYSTTQGYTPATGSGSSYVPGYWSATSGSGSTTDAGGSSFTYGGTGAYGGAYGGSGPDETLAQAGGASESFGYTKNYTIDGSGNWQVGGGTSGSGTGGASGSGWTTASYYGSTPALTDLPAFPTAGGRPVHEPAFGHGHAVGQQQHLLQLPDLCRLQRHRRERDGREDRHRQRQHDGLLLRIGKRVDVFAAQRDRALHERCDRARRLGQRDRHEQHFLQLPAIRLP